MVSGWLHIGSGRLVTVIGVNMQFRYTSVGREGSHQHVDEIGQPMTASYEPLRPTAGNHTG